MYQEILNNLGLTPNEAKIYEFLIDKGEAGISAIAVGAKIYRRNAYDAIQRLEDKGLVFQIFSSNQSLYNAVDPDKLSELIAEKQNQLDTALPDLKKKYSQKKNAVQAYIYRGLEGQKNIFRDVLRVGQDSYFIGAKGGWFDPKLEASRTAFFQEAKRRHIKFIQLYDHEVKAHPEIIKGFGGNIDYRYLPKKNSTDSGIHIFGDYVITYTGLHPNRLDEDIVFFVIHSKPLAEGYRKWFWYMWDKAETK